MSTSRFNNYQLFFNKQSVSRIGIMRFSKQFIIWRNRRHFLVCKSLADPVLLLFVRHYKWQMSDLTKRDRPISMHFRIKPLNLLVNRWRHVDVYVLIEEENPILTYFNFSYLKMGSLLSLSARYSMRIDFHSYRARKSDLIYQLPSY